jgi:hypothetical protein
MKWICGLAGIAAAILAVVALESASAGFFGFLIKLASFLILVFAALVGVSALFAPAANAGALLGGLLTIVGLGVVLMVATPRPEAERSMKDLAAANAVDDVPTPHIEIQAQAKTKPSPKVVDTINVGHVLGHWITPLPPSSSQFLTIRERDGVYESVLQLFHSNNPIVSKLKPRHSSRGRRFDDIADVAGTYYILLKNGDLDIWDKDGEFLVARRYEGPTDRASREKAMSALWDWAACRNDASCEGEKYRPDVLEVCPDIIERQARYEVRWTNHIFEGRFLPIVQWHGKNGRQQGLIDFEGDKVQFQNGFGAWQNYYYICTFDIVKKQIVDLKLKPGHLLYRMQ